MTVQSGPVFDVAVSQFAVEKVRAAKNARGLFL